MEKRNRPTPPKKRKRPTARPAVVVGNLVETSETKNCIKLTYTFHTAAGVNNDKVMVYIKKSHFDNFSNVETLTLG